MPLGAIATVVAGTALTIAIPVYSSGESGGAKLDWEAEEAIPDSKPAQLPGGGELKIEDATIASTRPNASNYRLYRIEATLAATGGNALPRTARCTIRVPATSLLTQSINVRASYPRPSEDDLTDQDVPANVVVQFNAKGNERVGVAIDDAFDEYTNVPGTVVEWAEYVQGRHQWRWKLPADSEETDLALSFASLWRTTGTPSGKIDCEAEPRSGQAAKVSTSGSIAEPPE